MPRQKPRSAAPAVNHPIRFRSGAVARMAGMPVSTLRVWEQRYQVVQPGTAASGHRLYSSADVERIALLRQLTENGHAIGSLAPLGLEELRALEQRLGSAQNGPGRDAAVGPLRVVVVGAAMAARLKRLALQPPNAAVTVVAVFDSLEAAAMGPQAPLPEGVDLLLWQAPSLHDASQAALQLARLVWSAREVAVVFRFARPDAREALLSAGVWVVREPSEDAALAAWLAGWREAHAGHETPVRAEPTSAHRRADAEPSLANPWLPPALAQPEQPVPARRFDDAALSRFGSLSSGMACECPSHVAELLMQMTSFETYSAECAHRSPADAELHAHLHRVAGAARVLLEGALVKVAEAEGWSLS